MLEDESPIAAAWFTKGDDLNPVSGAELSHRLGTAAVTYGVSRLSALVILLSPILIYVLYSLLLILHSTRDFVLSARGENNAIELLTFVCLLLGGVLGFPLAWNAKLKSESFLVFLFYIIFSIGLIATAMEEVAWGQWFFGFDTPATWKDINVQGELTLHNIQGIHGNTEFLRFAFGVGGLIGVWLARFGKLNVIGAPDLLLFWFLTISVHAGFDVYVEFYSIEYRIDNMINLVSEFTELMIGIAGLLYIWLNSRRIRLERKIGEV